MNTRGGLVKQAAENEGKSVQQLISSMKNEIAKALPMAITPERFTRIAITAVSSKPEIQDCTANSLIGALMQSAQLGLEPNTPLGQAYLIPYGGQVQFQVGYKGMIDLAYRTGEVRDIQAHEVRENDVFEYEYGLEPKLKHIPARWNRGNVIAYYAVVRMKNGGLGFDVMSRDEVDDFAKKKSKSYAKGPWQTDFDAMAKKTVLKRALKYAPISTEFSKVLNTDETIKSKLSAHMEDESDETVTIDNDTGKQVSHDERQKAAPNAAPPEADPSLFNEGAR